MRADVYQKLHEFNLHIDQGMATLRSMAEMEKVSAGEIRRMADYFEEIRTSASGYLTSVISDRELRESGRLFSKRWRREMAEDPMHGGWLEEEREKKRLKELREAKRSRKKTKTKMNRVKN
jgi:hypothetical protein